MDEQKLINFLDGLMPSDLARIVVRLPGASPYIPNGVGHHEQVANLILFVQSTNGPGLGRLAEVMDQLFPGKGPFRSMDNNTGKSSGTSLTLPKNANFSYLTSAERQELEDTFGASTYEYDALTRARLLDGVDASFRDDFLKKVGNDPQDQLFSDLEKMNKVERLSDGSIPLEIWLQNAIRRFRALSQRTVFEMALQKLLARGGAATPEGSAVETDPLLDFEEIITDGVDDLLDVCFLLLGAARLPGVMKLLVPRYENKKEILLPDDRTPFIGAGTGWLIASDLVMTNFHVVRNRRTNEPTPSDEDIIAQALGTQAQFFFDADGEEGRKIKVSEVLALGRQKTQDFALLRLAEAPGVTPLPLKAEPVTMPEPVQTPKGSAIRPLAVNIVQHPGGGRKRVAMRNNLVYRADTPTLRYFTDTLLGSSGSPVFNDEWRVIALHRAAVVDNAEFHGKRLGYVNEGIQIYTILEELENQATDNAKLAEAMNQIRSEQKQFG